MKSKNKATIEQINENLKKQFPGNQIACTEINENEIYIQSEIMNIVVTEKQIFKMATTESMMDYKKLTEDYHLAFVVKQFKYAVHIPFIPFRKIAGDKLKEQELKVLIACGFKKEKHASPLKRLMEIGGKMYVDIYKMIQQLEVTNAYLENHESNYGLIERLTIEHTKGKCSFPITDGSEKEEGELKRIFFEAINFPLSHKMAV